MRMFVYGTLQPGEGLASCLQDAYSGVPKRATTPGTLYHVWGGSDERIIFPVALVGPEEPVGGPLVHGTVLELTEGHPTVRSTIRMEERAGYERVPVVCTFPDGTTVEAVAFRYRRVPDGPQIVGGDWLAIAHGECEHDEDDDQVTLHWSEDTYGREYRVDCGCSCMPCKPTTYTDYRF